HLFAEILGQLLNRHQAIRFVAILVGRALKSLENGRSEHAMIFEIQRRRQAIGSQEQSATGLGPLFLGAVVAEKFLVGIGTQSRLGNLFILSGKAFEIHVEQHAKALALKFLERFADFGGGHGVLVTSLEGRIGGEVAAMRTAIAEGTALAEEAENDEVIAFGVVRDPAQRLENVL